MIEAPIYLHGWRAFVGALWQRIRWRTWTAYAPADDRGIERGHAQCKGEAPRVLEGDERLWFPEERP